MFWFILRDYKKWLVYDWSLEKLDVAMDMDDAIKFYHDDAKVTKDTIKAFGLVYTFALPTIEYKDFQKQIEDAKASNASKKPRIITKQFRDYLVKMARLRILSDAVYSVWNIVLDGYELVLDYRWWLLFLPKAWTKYEKKKETAKFNKEREGALILMKDDLMGFYRNEPYYIKIENEKKLFPIGKDYQIKHPRTWSDIIVKNNYGASLRNAIFWKAAEARAKKMLDAKAAYAAANPDDAKAAINHKEKPLLYWRQYDLRKVMGRRTCFTHIRRAGKTIFLVNAAIDFLLMHNDMSMLRPTSILFLSLAEKNIQAVIHYLLKMKESFGAIWDQMFHYDSKYNVFSFREWKKILGTITFISQLSRDPWVGNFVDALIVDEAPRIKYSVFKDFEPFITHEHAFFLAGSTMYEWVEKSWFYDYLIEYERESLERYDIDSFIIDEREKKQTNPGYIFDISAAKRYTLDDDENITEERKELLRQDYLKKSPARYLCELYSRFPDEGKVFNYSRSLQMSDKIKERVYKYVIIWYDPALTHDLSALIVVGYNSDTRKLVLLEEHTLNHWSDMTFGSQAKKIAELQKSLEIKYASGESSRPMFFVMDTTGNQKSAAELLRMFGVTVDQQISYTTGNYASDSPVPWEIRVPKKDLVKISQILFDESKVVLNNELQELIKQLENFYQIGNNQYEGKGSKDDHVNAMMLALYYVYETLGMKHELMLIDVAKWQDDKYLKRVHHLSQKDLIAYNKNKKSWFEQSLNSFKEDNDNSSYFSNYIR